MRTGLVRMQWTSLDHVALGDSHERAASSLAFPFDYFHVNSIALSPDGSLLLSARNTWAAYYVDARSGRIVWRLGGRSSTFREGPHAGTAWQHDPRVVGDGLISMFDNGAAPSVHGQSRGVVLRLNARPRTATLVRQLTHGPPLVAASQGNLQLLPGAAGLSAGARCPSSPNSAPKVRCASTPTSRRATSPTGAFASSGPAGPSTVPRSPSSRRREAGGRRMRAGTAQPR